MLLLSNLRPLLGIQIVKYLPHLITTKKYLLLFSPDNTDNSQVDARLGRDL